VGEACGERGDPASTCRGFGACNEYWYRYKHRSFYNSSFYNSYHTGYAGEALLPSRSAQSRYR